MCSSRIVAGDRTKSVRPPFPHQQFCVVAAAAMSNRQIGVLFSGGLDSTLAAALIARALSGLPAGHSLLSAACCHSEITWCGHSTVELINVAFGPPFETPDRISAITSLAELRSSCSGSIRSQTPSFRASFPQINWCLVCVDVPAADARAARANIEAAIFPRFTVMDANLAAVLWFGCRGSGPTGRTYRWAPTSAESLPCCEVKSKLLVSGLGPDELVCPFVR